MNTVNVEFAFPVIYKGIEYPAYTVIKADETDIQELIRNGAFILLDKFEESVSDV